MIASLRRSSLAALGGLVATSLLGADPAAAQFDHLTCVGVQRDLRSAEMPPPLTLTSAQVEFLSSQGCQPVGGGFIARADEVCFATNKSPSDPPGGVELSGQDFLCYRVKCAPNGGANTQIEIGDQFGSGTIVANQGPVTKRLCVPAFKTGGPTPTPVVTPTVTPTPTSAVTPTPTAEPTASPSPTPPYGSASKAFVEGAPSILD